MRSPYTQFKNKLFNNDHCRFWIAPTSSIPGRSMLIITSYLILTNMSTYAVSFNSPTFTAMDIWFYTCRFLVGGAILEFLFVLRNGSQTTTIKINSGPKQVPMRNQRTSEEQSAIYDRNAFIIFNVVFIIFCVLYFTVCFFLR